MLDFFITSVNLIKKSQTFLKSEYFFSFFNKST